MNKIVVAITGASGSVYAKLLLDKLAAIPGQWEEVAVILTENAKEVWKTELAENFPGFDQVDSRFKVFTQQDFHAPFASGSGQYNIMIIVPCSMGTLGRIATGISNDLISRSADVVLKERRKLICVVRDTPYNLVHIRNMETVTLAGGIIAPATPSFYSRPQTIEEVAATVVDRVLDLAGLKIQTYRWGTTVGDEEN
ncbi:MAG: UbiX family flavin prenyltransferase [Bacteroidota bacterium]